MLCCVFCGKPVLAAGTSSTLSCRLTLQLECMGAGSFIIACAVALCAVLCAEAGAGGQAGKPRPSVHHRVRCALWAARRALCVLRRQVQETGRHAPPQPTGTCISSVPLHAETVCGQSSSQAGYGSGSKGASNCRNRLSAEHKPPATSSCACSAPRTCAHAHAAGQRPHGFNSSDRTLW